MKGWWAAFAIMIWSLAGTGMEGVSCGFDALAGRAWKRCIRSAWVYDHAIICYALLLSCADRSWFWSSGGWILAPIGRTRHIGRVSYRYKRLFVLCLLVGEAFPGPKMHPSVKWTLFSSIVICIPTYAENSPNLWPTISSVILTSLYIFPLWTWNTRPTKLGRMVALRACVLIGGVLSPAFGRMIGRLHKSRG